MQVRECRLVMLNQETWSSTTRLPWVGHVYMKTLANIRSQPLIANILLFRVVRSLLANGSAGRDDLGTRPVEIAFDVRAFALTSLRNG